MSCVPPAFKRIGSSRRHPTFKLVFVRAYSPKDKPEANRGVSFRNAVRQAGKYHTMKHAKVVIQTAVSVTRKQHLLLS